MSVPKGWKKSWMNDPMGHGTQPVLRITSVTMVRVARTPSSNPGVGNSGSSRGAHTNQWFPDAARSLQGGNVLHEGTFQVSKESFSWASLICCLLAGRDAATQKRRRWMNPRMWPRTCVSALVATITDLCIFAAWFYCVLFKFLLLASLPLMQ